MTLLALGAVATGSAPAAASLVLKGGGQIAPVGTPARGELKFGPCGTFQSSGSLAVNRSKTDLARFTSTEETLGGCGEGGPIISGSVSADKLTETGMFVVVANLIYTTTLPEECSYALKRLAGKFTIPGTTNAAVSGRGRRTATSKSSCPETQVVRGTEAKLYDVNTNEPFEAEL
jgi:hypothetical protein